MRSEEEIQEMADQAAEATQSPKFSGMTYEEGVQAALNWVLGRAEDNPLE